MILMWNYCCVLMLFFWMFPVQTGYCTCKDIVKDLFFFLVQLQQSYCPKMKKYIVSRKIHHERTCVCLRKPGNPPAATSSLVESCTKWVHWWRSLQTGQPNECEQWVPGCTNRRHKVSRPCNPLAHRCKTHPQFIWVSTLENRSNFSC